MDSWRPRETPTWSDTISGNSDPRNLQWNVPPSIPCGCKIMFCVCCTVNLRIRTVKSMSQWNWPTQKRLGYCPWYPSRTCDVNSKKIIGGWHRKIESPVVSHGIDHKVLSSVFGCVSSVHFQPKEPKTNLLRWPKPRWNSSRYLNDVVFYER